MAMVDFITSLLSKLNPQSAVYVDLSSLEVLSEPETKSFGISHYKNLNEIDGQFEFIFGNLPFGMKGNKINYELGFRIQQNWLFLYDSLKHLADNGTAFYIVEPAFISSVVGKKFQDVISQKGFFINSILHAPERVFYPKSSFRPIIVQISKSKLDGCFIGEIDKIGIAALVDNLINRKDYDNLEQGEIINDIKEFVSFNQYRVKKEITNLSTQYKDYKQYPLEELAFEIKIARHKQTFDDVPNSIYITRLNPKVYSNISDITISHHNVFQIVLNPDKVISSYLELFFKSKLGKYILSSLISGNFIPTINKKDIYSCMVAIPPKSEQEILVHTSKKLLELQDTILELKDELSLSPKNAPIILEKFESIQAPLKSLTLEDEILGLIRKGESKIVEFKETFSKDIKTGKKEDFIKKSALKNIVGFLNAQGGTLLIGVSDNLEIKGVESDFYKDDDKYLLNFKNSVHSKIGAEFYPLIDYDLFSVMGKKVLKVDCKPSTEPCFYEGKEFFVRTNPATDKLEGKQLFSYIKNHFG